MDKVFVLVQYYSTVVDKYTLCSCSRIACRLYFVFGYVPFLISTSFVELHVPFPWRWHQWTKKEWL